MVQMLNAWFPIHLPYIVVLWIILYACRADTNANGLPKLSGQFIHSGPHTIMAI